MSVIVHLFKGKVTLFRGLKIILKKKYIKPIEKLQTLQRTIPGVMSQNTQTTLVLIKCVPFWVSG